MNRGGRTALLGELCDYIAEIPWCHPEILESSGRTEICFSFCFFVFVFLLLI